MVSFTIQEDECNHRLGLLPCPKLDQPVEPANIHTSTSKVFSDDLEGRENEAQDQSQEKGEKKKHLLSSFSFQYLIILQKNSKVLIFSSFSCCRNNIFGTVEVFSSKILGPKVFLCHLELEDVVRNEKNPLNKTWGKWFYTNGHERHK